MWFMVLLFVLVLSIFFLLICLLVGVYHVVIETLRGGNPYRTALEIIRINQLINK